MIKTLIVDDEELLRKGLIALVDWKGFGFDVVGETSNGKETLYFLEKHQVDVVITDIRMPLMNGLELMKAIRGQYPDIKTIVLSGYDDFSYAKAALECGSSGYILKPVEEDEVIKALSKVKAEIEIEINEKKFKKRLTSDAKRLFLGEVIDKDVADKDYFLNSVKDLDISFKEDFFCTGIGIMDDYDTILKGQTINELGLPKDDILEAAQNLINTNYSGEVFLTDAGGICVILNGEESILQRDVFFNELKSLFADSFGVMCTFGLGLPYKTYNGIAKSCKEAREALKYRISFGNNIIIDFERIKELGDYIPKYPFDAEQRLLTTITTGSEEKIITCTTAFLDEVFYDKPINIDDIRPIISELVISLKRYLASYGAEGLIDVKAIFIKLEGQNSIRSIQSILISGFIDINRIISKYKNSTGRKIVEDTRRYISERYFQKITLDEITEKFFVSKSYFCKIFKDETGTSFTNYLNNIRIEKAKELLKETNLKNYEVSEKLGFEDAGYFNLLFKKITGMTPFEYRNI